MKIIGKDKYDRDNKNDILVCTNILTIYVQIIIDILNERTVPDDYYYIAVPDDFVLYEFKP